MRNTRAALKWITQVLKEMDIPFEIDGGLAAEIYGTRRELADIDLNIMEADFGKILPIIKPYITFGPEYYKDSHWEMLLVSFEYAGQHVDIGALGTMKYFDKEGKAWFDFHSDLSEVRMMEWEGMMLPVINEMQFLIYKKKLSRGVDRKDVYGMEDALVESFGGNIPQ
ncbi:MAG: hypothetical protein JWM20_810 [Patescibacteria group bacterium]|nr:hypothetical protein [Patescibacteria group bacterium]